jgi:hypothetical protein
MAVLRSVDPPCDLADALLALIAAGDTTEVSERIVAYAPRVCVGWSLAGLFVVANEAVVLSERLTYQAPDLAVAAASKPNI